MEVHLFRRESIALAACLGFCATYPAQTAPIQQLQGNGSRSMVGFSPIGQSFTAEDPNVSIGFHVQAVTHLDPSSNEFRYDLLAGEGFSGTLLGSCTVTLPENFDAWADADFSFLNLNPGSKYTVRIAASDWDWVIYDNQWAASATGYPIPGRTDYAGGMELFSGEFFPSADLQFRVLPVPVPEPTTGTLLVLGIGLMAMLGRCKARGPGSQAA